MNTRFGWTLSGPVENAPRSEIHSVNLAATHVLRIDTRRHEMDVHEMKLDDKLCTFWELELIGIKQEENSVLETFKETVNFENQRYEVSLPWKTRASSKELTNQRKPSLVFRYITFPTTAL